MLLDTHAFLWWLEGSSRLPGRARDTIAEERSIVFVSAASTWEIATKFRIGKLPGVVEIVDDLVRVVASQAFLPLSVTLQHAQRAGLLDSAHRDPFDRMLIAQAQSENLTLISNETLFDKFAIQRLWE